MNREDIIRMAREAGFETVDILANHWSELLRFAALVAAAEREACEKVCEEWNTARSVAAAIRARGEPQDTDNPSF